MSALELLFGYLMLGEAGTSEDYKRRIEPRVRREAQKLYDVVAHELAEKQRAELERDPGILEPALIDLIDPEVSS